ncbi:Hypothetical protein D9617_37g012490 [Elsinoe fawcettii]|nr:Hypothetical protein D9617_37g012490 [Elsinoe fawcettii]
MFITLKNANGQESMEEVLTKAPNRSRTSMRARNALRRPACTACRKSKLRCTGLEQQCDRCQSRSILCVLPASPGPKLRQEPSQSPKNGTTAPHKSKFIGPVAAAVHPTPSSTALEVPPATCTTSAPGSLNTMAELDPSVGNSSSHMFQLEADHNFFEGLDLQQASLASAVDTSTAWFDMPTDVGEELANLEDEHPPSMASTDGSGSAHGISGPIPGLMLNVNASVEDNRSQWLGCSCVNNALGVIQQLDDDHYRLASLSLDQVIQLQKWIHKTSEACLTCETCKHDPKALTVTVIICERLMDMFECIHRRIDQATRSVSNGRIDSADLVHMMMEEPLGVPDSSSDDAGDSRCNTALFSSDFQTMYSGEEQVHMMRVLLRLQMRNLHDNLTKLKDTFDSKANRARRQKIASLLNRFSKAATAIEASLQDLLGYQKDG